MYNKALGYFTPGVPVLSNPFGGAVDSTSPHGYSRNIAAVGWTSATVWHVNKYGGGNAYEVWVKFDSSLATNPPTEDHTLLSFSTPKSVQCAGKLIISKDGKTIRRESDGVTYEPWPAMIYTPQRFVVGSATHKKSLYDSKWHYIAVDIKYQTPKDRMMFYVDGACILDTLVVRCTQDSYCVAINQPTSGTFKPTPEYTATVYIGIGKDTVGDAYPVSWLSNIFKYTQPFKGWMAGFRVTTLTRPASYYLGYWNSWKDSLTPPTTAVERVTASPVLSVNSYPNPMASEATVRFNVPQRQRVTVRVLDVKGRVVQELYKGAASGTRELTWEATAASGMYLLELRTAGGRIVKNIIIK